MNVHQLDTSTQSLAFIIDDHGIPEIFYWGPRLFEKLPSAAVSLTRKPLPDSKLIEYTPVSILPEYGRGFFGHPGLEGHRGSTQWATQFRMPGVEQSEDLFIASGEDPVAQLKLKITIFNDPHGGLFRISTRLENTGQAPYELEWLAAACLPLPNSCTEILTLVGRWNREFQEQRSSAPIGQFVMENRYGRTSHEIFPGLILGEKGFSHELGSVFGLHLGWSGNWKFVIDRSPHGQLLVQAGELFLPGELVLLPGQSYETPPFFLATARGLNDLSRQLHRLVGDRLVRFPDPAKPRPVH